MGTISRQHKKKRLQPSSSQIVNALCYVLIITVALVVLNITTSNNARKLLFQSKCASLQEKTKLITSSLSGIDPLTADNVKQVVELLGEENTARLIVTDDAGWCLYDNLDPDGAEKTLVMLPEVYTALSGSDVFHCSYEDGVTRSYCGAGILSGDTLRGAVYIMEAERQQSAMISAMERTILRISFILEAAVIAFSALFSTVFSMRMQTILQSFPKIRAGDYSYKIDLHGSDELAVLASEFNKLTDRLSESEAARRRFVSDASHELKTPLASIKLLAETILQNQLDSDTEQEFVSDICSEAERLNRMSQKLLQLSKMDSVQDDTEREVVDLQASADRVCRMLSPLAQQRGITLTQQIAPQCSVLAPADDMYQILFNLAENAIKYNRPDGSVSLQGVREGETVRLTISDTGVGIPKQAQSHIFERFYRIDKARSRQAGGAGLGLSIVHDMVQRNYGTIEVESEEGNGTRFILTFPYFGVEGDTP